MVPLAKKHGISNHVSFFYQLAGRLLIYENNKSQKCQKKDAAVSECFFEGCCTSLPTALDNSAVTRCTI